MQIAFVFTFLRKLVCISSYKENTVSVIVEQQEKKVVKPHDQLVPVSSTYCYASTPGLSTT